MIFTGSSYSMDKIVILGTGFIGKSILEYLKNKNIKVYGLSSKDIDLTRYKSLLILDKILDSETFLIFSAAITREHGDSLETMHQNIKMVINLCRYLQNKKIKKLVFLSSIDVYGYPVRLPISEDTPINPKTYYGLYKYFSELNLKMTTEKIKIPILILRYNGIFGPGQLNTKYGPNSFISSIKRENKLELWGDGKELRDLVFIEDLAKIITDLTLKGFKGTYNIATGKAISFIEIAGLLRKISPANFTISSKKRTSQKFDQVFNIEKLEKALPNLSFTPMSEALKLLY